MSASRLFQEEERRLQSTDCSLYRSETTNYNIDNPAVTTFSGIMFTIVPNPNPITITGFDVDVRLDLVDAPEDLAIQVYTKLGEFDESYTDPTQWTLIADTIAVVAPEKNGVIIPAQSFTPVDAANGQVQSFYLTMNKAIIDNTVYALEKTGELSWAGKDLSTFVGVGFAAPSFPGEFDLTVDPQFAGIIYYEPTTGECASDTVVMTEILFDFLFASQVTAIGNVNQIVSQTMDQLIQDTPELQQLEALYSLKIESVETVPKEYTGGCPMAWETGCLSLYQSTSVLFSHFVELDSNLLKYEVYKTAGEVTTAVQKGIPQTNVFYIGLESISADYNISLEGIPDALAMDDIQNDYFSLTTMQFYSNTTYFPAFQVTVDGQQPSRRQNLRSLQSTLGSSIVSGKWLGAKYHYLSEVEFRVYLDEQFRFNQELYLDMLKYNGLRPGPINEESRYTYFSNLTSASGQFSVSDSIPATEFPSEEANGSTQSSGVDASIIATIAVAIGVAVLIIGCIVFARLKKMNRDMVKLRDEDEDSVVFETLGQKDKKDNVPELPVRESPQRSRSFNGVSSSMNLDLFISSQIAPRDNKHSSARSVEEIPLSKRGAQGAGMGPSAVEHSVRKGRRRTQDIESKDAKTLSNFIESHPPAHNTQRNGSRSVGPGAVPEPVNRKQAPQTTTKVAEKSILSDFMQKHSRPPNNHLSGSRSVEELPVSQRRVPLHTPDQQKLPPLGGFLDGQSRQKDRTLSSGSRSVDGQIESLRRGGKRPVKGEKSSVFDDFLTMQSSHEISCSNGAQSIGPGVYETSTSPEERWGPLPKPPSMRRLIKTLDPVTIVSGHEPVRNLRRIKSMDSSSHELQRKTKSVNGNSGVVLNEKIVSDKEPARGVHKSKSAYASISSGHSSVHGEKRKKKRPPPLASLQKARSFDEKTDEANSVLDRKHHT